MLLVDKGHSVYNGFILRLFFHPNCSPSLRLNCDIMALFAMLGLTPFKMPIKPTTQFSTPFLKGSTPIPDSKSITATPDHHNVGYLQVYAAKKIVGRVVFAKSDKTLRVEVTRLAPHPLYKKRLRYKKDYHAHDPLNQFKAGDMVELQKCKPISKKKSFLAIPLPPRTSKTDPQELSLPLQFAE